MGPRQVHVDQVQGLDQEEDENFLKIVSPGYTCYGWTFIEEKVVKDDVKAAHREHAIVDDGLERCHFDTLVKGVVLLLEIIVSQSLMIFQ